MDVLKSGHKYHLDQLDGSDKEFVKFVNRYHGCDEAGTNCQEVLRMLIDRTTFMEGELHWHGNEQIIYHLRKSLVLFESRHLERMVDEGISVDKFPVGENGHFILRYNKK